MGIGLFQIISVRKADTGIFLFWGFFIAIIVYFLKYINTLKEILYGFVWLFQILVSHSYVA